MKNIINTAIISCIFLYNQNALAGENIQYAPAGEWVNQTDITELLKNNPDSNAYSVLWDEQIKIEDGVIEEYTALALKASTADFLTQMGTSFNATWQRDRADITIHSFKIYRAGQVIDILDEEEVFEDD